MHPGNIVSNQRCDGALQDQCMAMDHCCRMTHDVNASDLLALNIVLVAVWISVVSAQADIFAKNLTKIGKILKVFDELDEVKSRRVLCQS